MLLNRRLKYVLFCLRTWIFYHKRFKFLQVSHMFLFPITPNLWICATRLAVFSSSQIDKFSLLNIKCSILQHRLWRSLRYFLTTPHLCDWYYFRVCIDQCKCSELFSNWKYQQKKGKRNTASWYIEYSRQSNLSSQIS